MLIKRIQRRQLPLHLMLLPGIVLLIVYAYGPMFGFFIAFQKFIPAKGLFGNQQWVGLGNFEYVFKLPSFTKVIWNTIYIAFMKMVSGLALPIIFAILLNELRNAFLKRGIQTMIYLPHFLSWVILGGVLIDILSPSQGIVNKGIQLIGIEPIFFLGSNKWFPITIVTTNIWKEFGFGTIVYLAAITAINPEMYEAATIDGANRWQRMWFVTLPSMSYVIVLLAVLSLGNVLNAGFDQIFNLYSPMVYESGDILDTFVYRIGLLDAQFGVATAIGLFKSVVSLIFISTSYYLASKYAKYQIF